MSLRFVISLYSIHNYHSMRNFIMLSFCLLLFSCSFNKREVISTKFESSPTSALVKEIIYFKDSSQAVINLSSPNLNDGTYVIYNKNGEQIENGQYVNGLFKTQYTESELRGDIYTSLFLLILFLFLGYLLFKKWNNIKDYYRSVKEKKI